MTIAEITRESPAARGLLQKSLNAEGAETIRRERGEILPFKILYDRYLGPWQGRPIDPPRIGHC